MLSSYTHTQKHLYRCICRVSRSKLHGKARQALIEGMRRSSLAVEDMGVAVFAGGTAAQFALYNTDMEALFR